MVRVSKIVFLLILLLLLIGLNATGCGEQSTRVFIIKISGQSGLFRFPPKIIIITSGSNSSNNITRLCNVMHM